MADLREITVTVSGPVGSGKSAMLGEIEILCKALGLAVRYTDPAAAQSEKNMTHADWTAALDMYKPSVVLAECAPSREPDGVRVERALLEHIRALAQVDGHVHVVEELTTLLATPQEAGQNENWQCVHENGCRQLNVNDCLGAGRCHDAQSGQVKFFGVDLAQPGSDRTVSFDVQAGQEAGAENFRGALICRLREKAREVTPLSFAADLEEAAELLMQPAASPPPEQPGAEKFECSRCEEKRNTRCSHPLCGIPVKGAEKGERDAPSVGWGEKCELKYAPSPKAAPPAAEDGALADDALREMWRKEGGRFYGPNVETGAMPESILLPFLRRCLALRSQPGREGGEQWHLGSINDGLFIINRKPHQSNDHPYHDDPNGPTVVLNVTDLPQEKAQAIVDAHNAALSRSAK